MKIAIDISKCQGHGRCYELAPNLVEDDEMSRGVVITDDVPAELQDQAHEAANACPEFAVLLTG